MKHYYKNVPGLGNVALSRHAQDAARKHNVTDKMMADILENGENTSDGFDVILREMDGIRLVILRKPNPFRGAKLVKTLFRVEAQADAQKG